MSEFGARLRHARKLRKLTQGTLAQLVGIKQSSVSDLESGRTKEVSGPVLMSLSNALRVRPQWLMEEQGSMEPTVTDLGLEDFEIDYILALRERRQQPTVITSAPAWKEKRVQYLPERGANKAAREKK